MNTDTKGLEIRARGLLAAEYRRGGLCAAADRILAGNELGGDFRALRAIAAALASHPAQPVTPELQAAQPQAEQRGAVALDTKDMRAEFEEWAKARGLGLQKLKHTKGYLSALTADAWDAWQAAKELEGVLATEQPQAEQAEQQGAGDASIRDAYMRMHGNDYGWLTRDGSYFISGYQAALAARQPVGQEPSAWATHHDVPMLFPTFAEAAAYCADDERPIALFTAAPAPAAAAAAVPEDVRRDAERFRILMSNYVQRWKDSNTGAPSSANFCFECKGWDIDKALDDEVRAMAAQPQVEGVGRG